MGTWAGFRPNQATETVFSTPQNYECAICLTRKQTRLSIGPELILRLALIKDKLTQNQFPHWDIVRAQVGDSEVPS